MEQASLLSPGEVSEVCDLIGGQSQSRQFAAAGVPLPEFVYCVGCDQDLPLCAPMPGRLVKPVACPHCGRWHFADDHTDDATPSAGEACSAGEIPFESFASGDHGAARRIVEQLLGLGYDGANRRRELRAAVHAKFVCVPLGKDLQPRGRAFEALLLDLSLGGACFVMHGAPHTQRFLFDLAPTGCRGTQVIGEARWQRQERGGATRIGCEFLHRPGEPLPLSDGDRSLAL
ncbi:MAG: PilZ domain-containing protein [Planctomycetales bacterium]|nr:PilZ domain-containing protein [Planctomycetales bacterium]